MISEEVYNNSKALESGLCDLWYKNPETFSKKKVLAEVTVFLAVTFGIMLTFGWMAYPANAYDKINGWQNLCYYLSAFSPAIGCVVARYAFREGFRDDILFPKFKGHFKGYFLAFLLPVVFGIINSILVTFALNAGFTLKDGNGVLDVVAALSVYSSNFYIAFFILIGEELGWRGFLYDKLKVLFGLTGSIIIGGIIWGLWHIPPLITMGLNFGKDAPMFPVTNIILMCVCSVGFGAVLELLRELTDSVVAPIIAHAIIDTVCNVLALMFVSGEMAKDNSFVIGCCLVVSSLIVGIPCYVVIYKNSLR